MDKRSGEWKQRSVEVSKHTLPDELIRQLFGQN